MTRRTRRPLALVATVAVALALSACDSSNDDDGSDGSDGTDGGDGMPVDPGDTALDSAGDLATIVARGTNDEPFALDAAALDGDLAARFGQATDDAVDIEDDEEVDSLVNRRR